MNTRMESGVEVLDCVQIAENPKADCPRCGHAERFHVWPTAPSYAAKYPRAAGCGRSGDQPLCRCLYYVEQQKGIEMDVEEAGVGSRLRRWSCQCKTHTVKGVLKQGPFAFRGSASTEYSVFCQFCDAVFELEPETQARKRKSKLCGVHCPEGSHSHD